MTDEGLVNKAEDLSLTQTVEGVLIELESEGDAMNSETPEARGGGVLRFEQCTSQ